MNYHQYFTIVNIHQLTDLAVVPGHKASAANDGDENGGLAMLTEEVGGGETNTLPEEDDGNSEKRNKALLHFISRMHRKKAPPLILFRCQICRS